jgi:predicted NAD-dependent protein-ADP-ribosyltransferase YbiA (DUF1768 family)
VTLNYLNLYTEEEFLKATDSVDKDALETALCYIQQQKGKTSEDVTLTKKWRNCAAKESSRVFQRKVNTFLRNEYL